MAYACRAGLLYLLAALAADGGDLAFSDPARVRPAPPGAVGQAIRTPDLDALPGFQAPPPGFGMVPFYWWLGDPLTKDRLAWELGKMAGFGISGYQINYAHSDKGGHSYGLTMPSDPALFSPQWWDLTGWFLREAQKQGASISLSDYTLGFGQGWCVDELLREHPETRGSELRLVKGEPPADAVVLGAMPDGQKIVAVTVPWSLDPMNPLSGPAYAEKFFGRFAERFGGQEGKGLNFFFSDELTFGVRGRLWNARFADEFRRRKGYDIVPELPALFADTGPRTPKVRLDYSDVMVALSEEGYFKPVFDWHQQRGMTVGCDHGGRGRDVVEFGDYFRAQRWNQGPGSDQPGLGRDLIKAKVAASIAHLYQRPRVWLEGYYGSGWGTSSANVVDATFANFALGYNLLSLHGMYYATHGGWWEWAPPDNTFRMPYWQHMRGFSECVRRLSYLLTQGDHRCDVAILYPVAPMEAGLGGPEAVRAAFGTAGGLYGKSVDFDFMDFESLDRAQIVGRELHVSGEVYRVLVLPAMRAIRHSTLAKALAFRRAGGTVLAVGALPEVTDRLGRDDPQVAAMVKELFPDGVTADVMAALPGRDYDGPGYVQHRRVGQRDLYAVYNAPQGTECGFRATGRVELWDPWTGAVRPLAVTSQTADTTRLRLPLTNTEMQLIVFAPGQPATETAATAPDMHATEIAGDWEFALQPTSDNRYGDFHWPPTNAMIGAEARWFDYTEGDPKQGLWRRETCSFGPKFVKYGPVPASSDVPTQGGVPYAFSWRWGVEGDAGHQGYHGLKEEVHDEFIVLGKRVVGGGYLPTVINYEPDGGCTWLTTHVIAPRAMTGYALTGAVKPLSVRLNGELVTSDALALRAGANALALCYDKPGRTWFVVSTRRASPAPAEAVAFTGAAKWIWYPNESADGERWFRRGFELAKVPAKAQLHITCDNGYEVWLNGTRIGSGERWELVQDYDVRQALRPGRNELLVRAVNTGASAGLVAELTADAMRLGTDSTWQVAKTQTGPAVAAQVLSEFADSLWYNHPQGPPRLVPGATDSVVQPAFRTSPLAMSWWNNPAVLPFDVRADDPNPVGWYQFTTPPGVRAMSISTRGKARVWAGTRPLNATGDRYALPKPSPTPVVVLMSIEQERGCYGGAAIPEPIRFDCGPGQLALGDWGKLAGLACYSGGAWYRKTVQVPAAGTVVLDLGKVVASAEVRINGQPAGVRVAPPWTFDITRLVKPGPNRIEVLVCNTLANHYLTVPTQYRGATTSGLLGPVRLLTAD
ncbi:MAG: hypothetical protein HZB16_24755 [Armatimonadetes bacterium]|nr:hypothetical protein [Armatimonadota bacterium]